MTPSIGHPTGGVISWADRLWAGLRRLDQGLVALERSLAVLITAALVLTMAGTVVGRHLIPISAPYLLEAAPLLMLWLALVGASLALQSGRHIRLELVMRLMPPALRRMGRVVAGLCGSGLMGFLAYLALDFLRGEIELFGPRGWTAVIFPAFFSAAALRFTIQAAGGFIRAGKEAPP